MRLLFCAVGVGTKKERGAETWRCHLSRGRVSDSAPTPAVERTGSQLSGRSASPRRSTQAEVRDGLWAPESFGSTGTTSPRRSTGSRVIRQHRGAEGVAGGDEGTKVDRLSSADRCAYRRPSGIVVVWDRCRNRSCRRRPSGIVGSQDSGFENGLRMAFASVPEPSSAPSLTLGLMGLLCRVRRAAVPIA